MGSYLSEPITDKVSTDDSNDKLAYGASSMQGWRVSQEDAHNSILDYNESEAFFAVYDGHGGHEVAQYCAQKLPNFIKTTEAYKTGNIEEALIEGFLKFDASIASSEVVSSLKEIAGDKEAEEESDDEENVHNLYEEASMPIEKVIEKYTNLVNPAIKNLKKGEKLPRSPMISAKKDTAIAAASSSTSSEAGSSSKESTQEDNTDSTGQGAMSSNDAVSSSSSREVNGEEKKQEDKDPLELKHELNGPIPDIKISDADSSESQEAAATADSKVSEEEKKNETPTQNGDIASGKNETEEANSVTSTNDGEATSIKGKGKSPMKKIPKTPINTRPKRNATQLYKKLLTFHEESEEDDTEDEEDKTFQGPEEESSDEDPLNISIEAGASEEESSDGGEEEEEEEEEEDAEEDEDDLEFARNMKEEPGSDSGCTAVVALLKGTELYVANAGDSRCIVCRKGKAIEMSFDHKPEDEPERTRILKAGGKVTADGRVNGGLNLSRALGDHAYKQNKELSDKEQMITALPDIKKLTINPDEDEFMVLACDGIWNFMSSQEVVDFVKPRLDENPEKVSQICEEMFDHCLAPNTMGDGTGCDNMTAIIVKFKPNLKKRSMSPEPESSKTTSESKRAKTEEGPSSQGETTSSSS